MRVRSFAIAAWIASPVAAAAARAEPPAVGSIGFYSQGSLAGGVALAAEGSDHYLLFPARCYALPAFADDYADVTRRENFWGHAHTVQAILEVAAAVRKALPDAPRVTVAELSNASGGPIPHHLSHQNGLDADVPFLRHGDDPRYPIAPCTPYGAIPRYEVRDAASGEWGVSPDFDLASNWALAAAFAARKEVRAIFVGALIEKGLSDWSRQNGVPPAERRRTLAKLIQVYCPAPKGVAIGSYKDNFCPHDDHFHVRFFCPADSKRCRAHR